MSRRQSLVIFVLSAFIASIVLSISILITNPNDKSMPTLAALDAVDSPPLQHYAVSEYQPEKELDNQFIVQFNDDVNDRQDIETLVAGMDADWIDDIPQIQGAVIQFENTLEVEQLETLSSALVIEPNYIVQSLSNYPTNDPMLPYQWAWQKIDIPRLWDETDLESEVIIAVIDSGVCFSHPDLQGRFLESGYDFVDGDDDPSDQMGHGCAISGIIAANLDNGIGIAGIAPNVKILPLRVLDAEGVGTYANVMSAIFYAVDNGADIINLSLGGQNYSQLLEQAIDYAIDHGVKVVAGTGNTGQEGVLYPARYEPVIAVGSYNVDGNRSSFSTYGDEVDVLAPGENIVSTRLDGDYAYYSGTSMAAPHISALLALSNRSIELIDFDDMMSTPHPTPTENPTADYVQALATATATPTILAPTYTRPAPTNTPSSYTFSCNNISANFRAVPFNSNRVYIEIVNSNTQPAYLLETEVQWDKSPVQATFPDIFLSAMSLGTEVYWYGDDDTSPTNSNGEGTLLYNPDDRTHDIYAPADSVVAVWYMQFLHSPTILSDYFDTNDFAGTRFLFDNPDALEDDCWVDVAMPTPMEPTVTPFPTFTPLPPSSEPTVTPQPTAVTDVLTCTHNVASNNATDLINQLTSALATSGEDVICLGGGTYTLSSRTKIDDTIGYTGLPAIDSHITILGNGATIERNDNASTEFRIFTVLEGGTLNLHNLTLRNGRGSGSYDSGGAVYTKGDLSLVNVLITENEGAYGGGVVVTDGVVDIRDSIFTNNIVSHRGGAIYNRPNDSGELSSPVVNITRTEFVNNEADSAGAIENSSILNVTESKFIGNYGEDHSPVLVNGYNATVQFEHNCIYNNTSVQSWKPIVSGYETSPAPVLRMNWWGDPRGLSDNLLDNVILEDNLINPPDNCFGPNSLEFQLFEGETVNVIFSLADGGTPPYNYTELELPTYGSLSGSFPSYTYTAGSQDETLTYTVTDAEGNQSVGALIIDVRQPLTARHALIHADWSDVVELQMSAYGGILPIRFSEPITPTSGNISGTIPNFSYTFDENFDGSETIVYGVMDAQGTTVTNTWTLEINPPILEDASVLVTDTTPVDVDLTISGGMPPYHIAPIQMPTLGTFNGDYPSITFTSYNNALGSETVTLELTDNLGEVAYADLDITVCRDGATYHIADGDTQALINVLSATQDPACGNTSSIIELAPDGEYVFDTYVEDYYGESALPTITQSVTILGNGATLRRSDTTAEKFRLMTIYSDEFANIHVENLRVVNGYSYGTGYYDSKGGGIQVHSASSDPAYTTTLERIAFENNHSEGTGHALYVRGNNIIVKQSAFLNNAKVQGGSTVYTFNYSGENLFENNVFYGNMLNTYVFWNQGTMILRHNTFWNNGGYGFYDNSSYPTTVEGNIFGEASNGSCTGGIPTSLGYNIATDDGCAASLTGPGDQVNIPSGVGTLYYPNNSIIPILTLSSDSPAVDAIPAENCSIATDIRGTVRPVDSDGDSIAACEIGAVEVDATNFVVDKSVDQSNVTSGDMVTYTIVASNQGSLNADGVTIADILPASLRHISSTATRGTYEAESGLWKIGSLQVGESETLTMDTLVLLPLSGTTITNTVSVIGSTVVDNNNDFSSSVDVSVACPTADVFAVADGDTEGLREAIQAANHEACFPGMNTIMLASNGTYTFDDVFSDLNALPPITSEIIINGNNATITRDLSADDMRFIEVMPTGTLTLQNLTASEGYLPDDPGGAIYSSGDLTLVNVNLLNNTSRAGGAIYQTGVNLTIDGSVFDGNSVVSVATGGPYRIGGALGIYGSTANITNTVFSGNQVLYYAYSPSGGGGAISAHISDLFIQNVTFINNSAPGGSGGAVYIDNNYEDYQVIIDASTFTGNYARGAGGGIISTEANNTVTNSIFTGNVSSFSQGGAALLSRATIHNSIFANNQGYEYGALSLVSVVDVSHLTIVGNHTSRTITGAYDNQTGSLSHSILANNTGGRGNCSTKYGDTGGYNISDDDSCTYSFDDPTDLNNAEFEVYPLGYYGTSRQVILPKSDNLIDVIPLEACDLTDDYYGNVRPQGSGCDIGAVELTGNELIAPYDLYIAQGNIGDIWTMTWENKPTVEGYELQYAYQPISGSIVSEIINLDGGADSYPVDTSALVCDVYHNYKIRSYRDTYHSDWSNEVSFILPCDKQPTPDDFTGVAISLSEIEFTWTPISVLLFPSDTEPNILPIDIEQFNPDTSRWEVIRYDNYFGTVIVDNYSCEHSYQFRARIFLYDLWVSDYTDIVQVDMPLCPLNAPADLSYELNWLNDAVLSWTDTNDYEDNYVIERSLDGNNWSVMATVDSNTTTYTDDTIEAETTYHYRVRAYYDYTNRYSDYSDNLTFDTGVFKQLGPVYTVNIIDDRDATCIEDTCSLREAINASNLYQRSNSVIVFDLPGNAPYLLDDIYPGLPEISHPVILDGWSQSGWIDKPIVHIDGVGFRINSHDVTIRGFVLTGASKAIQVPDDNEGDRLTIVGNYIGVDPSGTVAMPNGVGIYAYGHWDFVIGGLLPYERNIISGNTTYGIHLDYTSAVIQNNLVGLDVTGSYAIGNGYDGMRLIGRNTIVGGDTPSARNIISGNGRNGIYATDGEIYGNYIGTDITGTSAIPNSAGLYIDGSVIVGDKDLTKHNVISGNTGVGIQVVRFGQIQGNYIGADATGDNPLPNTVGIYAGLTSNYSRALITDNVIAGNVSHGIQVVGDEILILRNKIGMTTSGSPLGNNGHGIYISHVDATFDNVIGDHDSRNANIIAQNGGNGIALVGQADVGINQIYDNDQLGIDVLNDAVINPNDMPDEDDVPNYPILENVRFSGNYLAVSGTLTAKPDTKYQLYLYKNGSCDASGHGEAEMFVTSPTVTTNVSGVARINFAVMISVSSTDVFSMSATNDQQTSEFSPCVGLDAITDLIPPTNLHATNVLPTGLTLEWNDNSSDETSFVIEQLIGNVWVEVDNVPANITTYNVSGLVCNTDYTFRVKSYRTSDTSYAFASAVTAKTDFCLPVSDADIYVTTTADEVDGVCDATHCSLREAVDLSNSVAGIQTIHIPAGEYLIIHDISRTPDGEDNNENGDLDILDDVNLIGAGRESTILKGNDRILHVQPDVYMSIESVTIFDGEVRDNPSNSLDNGKGGAIANWGDTVIEDVLFTYDAYSYPATNDQIYNASGATMSIYNSDILVIDEPNYRRRLALQNEGYMEIDRMLITQARGVLDARGDSETILTNVIVYNSIGYTTERTILIYGNSEVTINYSTFVRNSGNNLFYLSPSSARLNINNSIVLHSQYTNTRPCYPDYNTVFMTGMNILSSNECDQLVNAPYRMIYETDADIRLSTQSFIPFENSPVINAAVGECPATDYYGNSRPIGSACDIGAVESFYVPLTPPTNLTGTISNNTSVNLSWQNHTSYETGYVVERSTDNTDWSIIATLSTDTTAHSDTSLACFTDYYYRVSSQYNISLTPSDVIHVTTGCEPLAAPSNFMANFVDDSVNLSWDDTNLTETQYTILRRVSGLTEWETLHITPPDTISYTDASIICEASYEYQIEAYRAVDDNRVGSTIESVSTPICPVSAPTTFAASNITETSFDLSWVDVADNETGYVLFEVTDTTDILANLPPDTQSYAISGLECASEYTYQLQAYRHIDDMTGESEIIELSVSTGHCKVHTPGNPTPSNTTRNTTTLTWQDTTPEQTTHFIIQRAIGTNTAEVAAQALTWNTLVTISASRQSYVDDTLTCGTIYSYRIQGYDAVYDEYSDYSEITQIETDECPAPVTNTIGLYHEGQWIFREGFEDNLQTITFRFGPQKAGWIPLTGDWDGDGVDGIGIYKNGVFALRDISSRGATDYVYRFGNTNTDWQPIVGDWNGDGVDTVGLYYEGQFILTDSNIAPSIDYRFRFGKIESGWLPVAGDWFGQGRDNVGVYKDGKFNLHHNFENSSSGTSVLFGVGDGWQPIAGDWDADGYTTIGLYKDSSWRLTNDTENLRTVDIGIRFDYFNGQGYPLASYRGGESTLQALALFAVENDIDLDVMSQPQDEVITDTPSSSITPTQISDAISPTAIEADPTITPMNGTEAVSNTITPTLDIDLPIETPTASSEWSPTPSATVEPTIESTLEPSAIPTNTALPPTAIVIPTQTAQSTDQPSEPTAIDAELTEEASSE